MDVGTKPGGNQRSVNEELVNPSLTVAVVGAGYVGLVTAACLSSLGHRVRCVDIDAARIRALRVGVVPIHEPGLVELVERGLESRTLGFHHELADALVDAVAFGGQPRQQLGGDLAGHHTRQDAQDRPAGQPRGVELPDQLDAADRGVRVVPLAAGAALRNQ